MKKFVWIIVSSLFVLISLSVVFSEQHKTASTSLTSGFAKVVSNNAHIYKTPQINEELENKLFLLEKSYFVKVLEDTNDIFFKVEYLQTTGYVKKSNLNFVAEIPSMPYLVGITFDIGSSPCLLRSEPTTANGDNTILTVIAKNTRNLVYLGKISGEESIESLGNIWFYTSYTNELNQTINGYIYSPLTLNLSPIQENGESLTTVNITSFSTQNTLLYLNLSTKNLILVIIALPTLIILWLLIRPTHILKN